MPIIYYNNEYIDKTEQEIKELFETNKLTIDNDNDEKGNNEFNLGVYYKVIEKDYELAKKYYLMAIEKDNTYALNIIGSYYKNIEKNYELAKKYYLMAIEKGNSTAMSNLGVYYYKDIEKNYELAKKYYLMAIEKGNSTAMNNLGIYYYEIEENYELAKKYYLMAICRGNTTAKEYIKNITTCLERYILFKQNNIKFEEEMTREIHIYNNKINKFSIEEKCPICIETKKCIPLECCHYICIECYPKLYEKPCPVCRL